MLQKYIRIILLATPFTVLFSPNDSFFPFIAGKVLLFALLMGLVSLLMIYGASSDKYFSDELYEKCKKFLKHKVTIGLSVFITVVGIATWGAYEPFVAWHGSFVRWEGYSTTLLLFLYFWYLSLFFTKESWRTFLRFTFFSLLIIFLFELGQLVSGIGRPGSLLGNPLFLAQYFLLAGGMTLAGYGDSLKKKSLLFLSGIFLVIGILLTQTRGVIVGLYGGFVALLIVLLVQKSNARIRVFKQEFSLRRSAGFLLGMLLIGAGIFFTTQGSSFWKHVPILKRISTETIAYSAESRILSIKTSFNAITPKSEGWKRTLFGWGSENYQFAWAKYYNPEVYRYESAAFDRAHDKYLDIIVMYGVIGLLSYLVFLVACTRAIMRLKGLEKYILFVVWIAYCIQNLFAFDSFTGLLYTMVLGAYVVSKNVFYE